MWKSIVILGLYTWLYNLYYIILPVLSFIKWYQSGTTSEHLRHVSRHHEVLCKRSDFFLRCSQEFQALGLLWGLAKLGSSANFYCTYWYLKQCCHLLAVEGSIFILMFVFRHSKGQFWILHPSVKAMKWSKSSLSAKGHPGDWTSNATWCQYQ